MQAYREFKSLPLRSTSPTAVTRAGTPSQETVAGAIQNLDAVQARLDSRFSLGRIDEAPFRAELETVRRQRAIYAAQLVDEPKPAELPGIVAKWKSGDDQTQWELLDGLSEKLRVRDRQSWATPHVGIVAARWPYSSAPLVTRGLDERGRARGGPGVEPRALLRLRLPAVKVVEHADENSGSRELDVAIQVEGDALSAGGGYLCVNRVATDRVAVVLLEAKPVCHSAAG